MRFGPAHFTIILKRICSKLCKYRVVRVAAGELSHSPLNGVFGGFPVRLAVPVIIFIDKPRNIVFQTFHIFSSIRLKAVDRIFPFPWRTAFSAASIISPEMVRQSPCLSQRYGKIHRCVSEAQRRYLSTMDIFSLK